jgi:hypothetical protein
MYHFVISHQDRRFEHDPIELKDDHGARQEITTACGGILRHDDGDLLHGPEGRMDVADAGHKPLIHSGLFLKRFARSIRSEEFTQMGKAIAISLLLAVALLIGISVIHL